MSWRVTETLTAIEAECDGCHFIAITSAPTVGEAIQTLKDWGWGFAQTTEKDKRGGYLQKSQMWCKDCLPGAQQKEQDRLFSVPARTKKR